MTVARSTKIVLVPFCVCLMLALAFGSRHLFGILFHGRTYSPFSYDVRALQHPDKSLFAFMPDAVVWDETRAYARFTREIMRGEMAGADLPSYRRYLLPDARSFGSSWPNARLAPAVLAGLAMLVHGNVATAFIVADFVFIFFFSLL